VTQSNKGIIHTTATEAAMAKVEALAPNKRFHRIKLFYSDDDQLAL